MLGVEAIESNPRLGSVEGPCKRLLSTMESSDELREAYQKILVHAKLLNRRQYRERDGKATKEKCRVGPALNGIAKFERWADLLLRCKAGRKETRK